MKVEVDKEDKKIIKLINDIFDSRKICHCTDEPICKVYQTNVSNSHCPLVYLEVKYNLINKLSCPIFKYTVFSVRETFMKNFNNYFKILSKEDIE